MVALRSILLLLLFSAVAMGESQLLCFGAKWCQPCREMDPIIEQLVRDGYPLRRIDVDQHPDLAQRYKVQAVPAFVLIDANGGIVDRINQATTQQMLVSMLAHYRVAPRPAVIRGQGDRVKTEERIASSRGGLSEMARAQAVGVPAGTTGPIGGASPATGDKTTPMAATVRLKVEDQTGHSFGTGTVIDVHGSEALVVTCGHIFRPSAGKGKILIDRFDMPGEPPMTGSLISYDMDLDIGLVSMKLTKPIAVAKLASPNDRIVAGDAVFSIGCSRGASPTVMDGNVNQIDRYLGPPNITASGQPVDGRSGGGLFNRSGELIGVCCAADPELDEGLYGALARVDYELERNGLTFIRQRSASATSQASGTNQASAANAASATNAIGSSPNVVPVNAVTDAANAVGAAGATASLSTQTGLNNAPGLNNVAPLANVSGLNNVSGSAITDTRNVLPPQAVSTATATAPSMNQRNQPSTRSGLGVPVSAAAASGGPTAAYDELVCVLKGENEATTRVFVIKQPSAVLLDYLQREAERKP